MARVDIELAAPDNNSRASESRALNGTSIQRDAERSSPSDDENDDCMLINLMDGCESGVLMVTCGDQKRLVND